MSPIVCAPVFFSFCLRCPVAAVYLSSVEFAEFYTFWGFIVLHTAHGSIYLVIINVNLKWKLSPFVIKRFIHARNCVQHDSVCITNNDGFVVPLIHSYVVQI